MRIYRFAIVLLCSMVILYSPPAVFASHNGSFSGYKNHESLTGFHYIIQMAEDFLLLSI